jgi:CDP-glycerol glycerophosphotransferase (TagB/SpsB family)
MFYGDEYEKVTKVDEMYLDGISSDRLRDMVEPHVLRLVEAPSFRLGRAKSINEVVLKDISDNSITALLIRSYRWMRRSLKGIARGTTWKFNGSSLAERRLQRNLNRKIQSLYTHYNGLTEKPDASDKYVLFALHYQPERTTLPEGGIFENQLLAIDILSRALPEGWWLYVREHPRQFQKNDPRKAHFRDYYYYQRIKTNRNVRLISVHENQEALIEGARVVASIKGDVGWEAMTRGKPSITFARAWYSSSNACFLVSSVEDCKVALHLAFEMDKETVLRYLYRFLLFNTSRMILASDFLEGAEKSILGYDTSVKNLADSIIKIARSV